MRLLMRTAQGLGYPCACRQKLRLDVKEYYRGLGVLVL